MMWKTFNTIFLVLASFGCFGQQPYVLLVSFDGFRHNYVEQFDLPNFKAFEKKGARTESLIPSFPSKTFPNHYTIVTGLYPGNHGLIDNSFYDRERNVTYSMGNRKLVTDPYFYGGTPLWTLVQQHGMKSASYFWVGSEIPLDGYHPDYYYAYDGTVPFESRIEKVTEWLKLPPTERPHFITLYFSSPDHEGHEYGPTSPETKAAAQRMDGLLKLLMDSLNDLTFPVNVFLVSDHGMKELTLDNNTFVFLDEIMDVNDKSIKVVSSGTQAHLYIDNPSRRDSIYANLSQKQNHFVVLKKEQYDPKWHYDHPGRVGDLMIMAEPGYYIREKGRKTFLTKERIGSKMGVHGYDPLIESDVHGIFYAQGPNIKEGITIPSFQNIHIYPLIAKILGMEPPKGIDGKAEVLDPIYKK
ncbi:MAG: ectonucleotide pyrophosphatase/phosphodiesterase [Cyclobacteriaceae bacterium]